MLDLITSRRFQTAIAALLFAVLTYFMPQLEGHEQEFMEFVLLVFGGLLGSYTIGTVSYNLGKGKAEAQNTTTIKVQEPSAQALPVIGKTYASVEEQLAEISYRLKALEAYGFDTSSVLTKSHQANPQAMNFVGYADTRQDFPIANKAAVPDDGDHA